MSGTKQDNTRAEEFKRATAGVLRAIAEQPDVQVAFQPGPSGVSGKRARLPLPTRALPPAEMARLRGASDAIALRLRHHDDAVHTQRMPSRREAKDAYDALERTNRDQTTRSIRRVAALYGLPTSLMLAIAWQESGWTQHVIAWDGGIGVMQLMPYTAMSINAGIGQQLDPYSLEDNLDLGATYLQWLWDSFDGNLPQVISAYNEGGWAVRHRGIFNWHYVNNVLALMKNLE